MTDPELISLFYTHSLSSKIGIKQGCPPSPTLFGLYIDGVLPYIERFGSSGEGLAGIGIRILLYADDIVLISDNQEEL